MEDNCKEMSSFSSSCNVTQLRVRKLKNSVNMMDMMAFVPVAVLL